MSTDQSNERLKNMRFGDIYAAYVAKVERKGHTEAELLTVLTWLTGYSEQQVRNLAGGDTTMAEVMASWPAPHPNRDLITGVICGVRVEDIEDPFMRPVRQMDKLVDELARGKKMESILRKP